MELSASDTTFESFDRLKDIVCSGASPQRSAGGAHQMKFPSSGGHHEDPFGLVSASDRGDCLAGRSDPQLWRRTPAVAYVSTQRIAKETPQGKDVMSRIQAVQQAQTHRRSRPGRTLSKPPGSSLPARRPQRAGRGSSPLGSSKPSSFRAQSSRPRPTCRRPRARPTPTFSKKSSPPSPTS